MKATVKSFLFKRHLIIIWLSAFAVACVSEQSHQNNPNRSQKSSVTPSSFGQKEQSLYIALGGKPAVDRLVSNFFYRLHNDRQLKELFVDSDKRELRQNIADFICEISDGDCEYQGVAMEDIHAGLEITEGEFDHFVTLFILTMKNLDIPFQAQNR